MAQSRSAPQGPLGHPSHIVAINQDPPAAHFIERSISPAMLLLPAPVFPAMATVFSWLDREVYFV